MLFGVDVFGDFNRSGIFWDSNVQNLPVMVNNIDNGWRMKTVRLDGRSNATAQY